MDLLRHTGLAGAMAAVIACASEPADLSEDGRETAQRASASGESKPSMNYPAALTDEFVRSKVKEAAEGGFSASLAATVYNAKVSVEIPNVARREPREWDPDIDYNKERGGSGTIIYPVQVLATATTTYNDGSVERERIDASYHFYQDKFDTWFCDRWSHEVLSKEAE